MKPTFYFEETYQENFWFFIGWSVEDFRRYNKLDDSWIKDGCDGICIEIRDGRKGRILIWTRHKPKDPKLMPILAHECLHATNRCLERVGVHPSFVNDETQAYLLGLLIRKALKQ